MRSQCLARCRDDAPTLDMARKAIVDAYYELADAYVMMPRPADADAGSMQKRRRLAKIGALEASLRDAARALARESARNGDRGPARAPEDRILHDWLERFLERLDALRDVRSTGLTETHARSLYQLKQLLDHMIDN